MRKLLILMALFIPGKIWADSKLSALTADTTAQATDLLYKVDNPAGTPVSRSIAVSDLFSQVAVSSLSATGVTAGSYTNTSLTVNAQGRISAASNGTAGSGGYAVEPATVPFKLNQGFSATSATFTALSPGVMHIAANSSATVTGLVSLSTEVTGSLPAASIAAGNLGPSVKVSSVDVSGFFSNANVRSNLGLAIGTDVQAWDADLDDLADGSLTGSKVGSGVPAANIASGSLGANVIASSIAASGVTTGTYGSATQVSSVTINGDGRVTGAANVTISLTNSNLQSGTYSNVTVPAANVAAGSLGASVIASSFTPSGVTAGSYTNTNLTVDAQGRITTASNGSAGSGSGSSIYSASSTASFPFGMTVSTVEFLSPYAAKSVFLNAGSGLCQTSNGCSSPAQFQTATSSINYVAAIFQAGTTQYWQTNFTIPRNYVAASTFTVNFVWTTTMSVVTANWKIDMMSVANTGSIDTAWGTAVTISTASTTSGAVNISQDSGAITAGGSPAVNKQLYVRVYRNGDAVGDVRFLGVRLYYLYNKLTE